jgi:hypothetical protein
MRCSVLILLSLLTLLAAPHAFADTLSAVGGLSFGRNTGMNDLKSLGPMLGMEYTFPVSSKLQVGGFFNYTALTSSNGQSDTINFMGASFRFDPGAATSISPFVDAKVGVADRTENGLNNGSGMELSEGAGVGVRFPLSKHISISPHAEVDSLPGAAVQSAGHQAIVSGAMMFSFHF